MAESLRARGFQVEQVVRQHNQLEPDLPAGRFDAVLMSHSYLLDSVRGRCSRHHSLLGAADGLRVDTLPRNNSRDAHGIPCLAQ